MTGLSLAGTIPNGNVTHTFAVTARISYSTTPIAKPVDVVPANKLPTGPHAAYAAVQAFVGRIHDLQLLYPAILHQSISAIDDAKARLPADMHLSGEIDKNNDQNDDDGMVQITGPAEVHCIRLSTPYANVATNITAGACPASP